MNRERKLPQDRLSVASRQAIYDDITAYYAGVLAPERQARVKRLLELSPELEQAARRALEEQGSTDANPMASSGLKAVAPGTEKVLQMPTEQEGEKVEESVIVNGRWRSSNIWAAAALFLILVAGAYWLPRLAPKPGPLAPAKTPAHPESPELAKFLAGKPTRQEGPVAVMGNAEPARSYEPGRERLRFPSLAEEECPILKIDFQYEPNGTLAETEANLVAARKIVSLLEKAAGPGSRLEFEVHLAPAEPEDAAAGTQRAEQVRRLLAPLTPPEARPPRVVALGAKYFREVEKAVGGPVGPTVVLLVKRWRAEAP